MYEIRFYYNDVTTFVSKKFSTKKAAISYYNEVINVANKSNYNGEVALWNKGWLEKTMRF